MLWSELTSHFPAALGMLGGGYLLGCFNTAYYLVRIKTGKDIRELGTGNAGAKNVSRVLGRPGFLLAMGGDGLKGALASSLALALSGGDDRMCLLASMGVIAGHVWPVQLGFRGGKGASTSVGALLMYSWPLTLIFTILFILGLVLTKKGTLCGLISYALLPVAAYFLRQDASHIIGISALAGLIILAHYKNVAEEISQLLLRRTLPPEPDSSS